MLQPTVKLILTQSQAITAAAFLSWNTQSTYGSASYRAVLWSCPSFSWRPSHQKNSAERRDLKLDEKTKQHTKTGAVCRWCISKRTIEMTLLMQALPWGCLSNSTIIASCQVISRHLPRHCGERLRLRDDAQRGEMAAALRRRRRPTAVILILDAAWRLKKPLLYNTSVLNC